MENKNNKYQGRIGKQFKSINLEVKAELNADNRTISGYLAVFGNKDKAGDILIKGCFAKSLQERGVDSNAKDKIIFLYMHDMREPIGHFTVLKEDDHGLYFEAYIDDVPRGNQTIKQLESGTLNQFSIGFRYVWDKVEYDEEQDAYIVKEVVLYEGSVVSIGANGETEYLGLKSDEDYTSAYSGLDTEICEVCKGLTTTKQQEIQYIVAKAMALAANKPVKPLEEQRADTVKQQNSILDLL
jgi:HK97 family phage prohead protease